MNSHVGNGVVEYDGGVYTTENIPPMGYAVVDSLYSENHAVITENSIENKYFRIKFNDMGYMESIYDKREDRELLRKGELGNELLAYEDYPYHCFGSTVQKRRGGRYNIHMEIHGFHNKTGCCRLR